MLKDLAPDYTISPLSENAVLVSFQNAIDVQINQRVVDLDQRLKARPFAGFIETVPAYSSLAVFFDPIQTRSKNPECKNTFGFVNGYIEMNINKEAVIKTKGNERTVMIPVFYNGEDLEFVADQHQLSKNEIIAIHTSAAYRVFMIGFLPGFAYMGKLDVRIATPRKSSPRTEVPAGSVGIAGFQTGIYPQASPGGWQLIGRTPLRIFDKQKPSPCLMRSGDIVQLYSINQNEFDTLNEY